MGPDVLFRAGCLALAIGAVTGCSKPAEKASPAAETARATDDVVPGAIVVDFKDGTTKAEFDAWENQWGIDLEFNSVEGPSDGVTIAVGVDDVDRTLAEIRQNAAVESAEPLLRYQALMVPNDPEYSKQWNLKMIDAESAWDQSTGKGVIVAVIDTGIAYQNKDDFILVPDLNGAKFAKGYDFVNDDDQPNDDHGHGTHVAGTIAQVTNNKEGVAGVAFDATLMPLKVLDAFGTGNSSDISDAIRFAADHGAKVINLSLGGGMRSQVMANAVKYARSKGVTVVCAAGNTGMGHVEFPAAYEGAVAVSAVGPDGKLAPYSSWGEALDLAAPGGNKSLGQESGILQNTIARDDHTRAVYDYYQGTSMAAPHVSGVAALLYAHGASGPDEVEKALYAGTTRAQGQDGWNDHFGHGILNAKGALSALGKGPLGVNWRPLWVALGMLVVVLLTMRAKQRPGYLNVLVRPTFFIPLVLATVGFFVVRFFVSSASGGGGSGSELTALAELPIPEWRELLGKLIEKYFFGFGKFASPLFYSALIPFIASIVAIRMKSLRPVIGGLALGFGAFLAYAAWAGAPALSWMPLRLMAIPWLVFNTVVCLVITRAMLKKDVAA